MLNNEYPPIGGGTGTVNKEIITYLKNNSDIKIDLITGSCDKKNSIEVLSENVKIIKIGLNNRNIHHASNYELIKYTFKASIMAMKMQKKHKYDFSFAWSTVPAGFVSYLLYLVYKLPFIVRVGGPDIPGYEDRYAFIYKIITPIIKRIWKKAKYIVTKCKTETDMICSIVDNLPLITVFNGINTDKFTPTTVNNNSYNLKVICTARLIKRKGQDTLIKAIARLKHEKNIEITCDLVGDGDERKNYIDMVNGLGVGDLINFKSSIPREAIVEAYNLADIFVLPSHNEGMSNAVLEAMACGLPLLVTDVGGTLELITEGENGFIFEKSNDEELAFILEKLYKNKDLRVKMGEKSRKKATNFSWSTIGKQYISLFDKM